MYRRLGAPGYYRHDFNYRKFIVISLLILLAAVIFGIYGGFERAEGATDEEKVEEILNQLKDEIDKGVGTLVSDDLDEYFSTQSGLGSLKEFIKDVTNGENFKITDIFTYFTSSIKNNVFEVIAGVSIIVVLSVLGGMSDALTSGFKRQSTKTIVYFAIYSGAVAAVTVMFTALVKTTVSAVNDLNTLVQYVSPVFITLLTALGGVGGAEMLAPFTLLIGGVVISVINALIIPLFFAALVFTIIGNLSDNVKLGKLTKAVKSIGSWVLGGMFGLVTTLASIQGLVGAGIDTITVKSAKFAVSGYIPILGGYISEGFDIVMAGGVLIKNAFGLGVFIMLVAIAAAPLVKLVLFSLVLKLTAGIIEPVGDPKISEMVYGAAGCLNLLIAAVAGTAFLVFVMLLLVIGAFNTGVV